MLELKFIEAAEGASVLSKTLTPTPATESEGIMRT